MRRLQTPPLFIANEAFRGLPQWQAVLREGSAVPCTTESWVPQRGGGVTSVARRKKIVLLTLRTSFGTPSALRARPSINRGTVGWMIPL